jgi:hypothetical protein
VTHYDGAMAREILSISAAPGWTAEFDVGDDGEPGRRVTLAAWALVDGGAGGREVVGLVVRSQSEDGSPGRIGFADEVDGFGGYRFGGLRTRPAED